MDTAELESELLATIAQIETAGKAFAKAEAEYLRRKDLAELSFEAIKDSYIVPGTKQSNVELHRKAIISKEWKEESELLAEARRTYLNAKIDWKIASSTLDALRSISSIEKMKLNLI